MPGQKAYLNQSDVQKILAAANAHAEKNNWAVSIAVVDDGGHLLGFTRRDNCPPVSAYIAQEKGRASALGRRESKIY
jgi:glc operon protein GlcG